MLPKKKLSSKDKAGFYALGSVLFLFLIPISLLIAIGVFEADPFSHQTLTLVLATVISLGSVVYGLWFTVKAVQQLLEHSKRLTKSQSPD